MRYRRFGRTGWNVSEIGYGMWGMAGWTGSDDKESLGSLQSAIDLGCNFFDTAWAYGDGHSEQLLGQLLKRQAGTRLYSATKIPPKNRRWPARPVYRLKEEGLVRAVGISINRWQPSNVLRALDTGLIDSVQVVYNVLDQNP